MSKSPPGAVIHRNVSVIACDSSATLQETLHHLEDADVELVQIGERHLALPASQLPVVMERMRSTGQFPRLVGEIAPAPDGAVKPAAQEEQ